MAIADIACPRKSVNTNFVGSASFLESGPASAAVRGLGDHTGQIAINSNIYRL
jgi:hypothetical protein